MYTTTRINDESYQDLQVLHKQSFGFTKSISEIKKKYNTHLFGLKNVGLMAKDKEGKPAAYYGVFPIILNYNSKDYLVAQSGDTMTSPNHRKKGLFVKLAKETYVLSETLGIKMIFGFPNKFSYPGFKNKLNWVFTQHMHTFTLKIQTVPFCELSSKFQYLEPFYDKFFKKRISKYTIEPTETNILGFKLSNNYGQIKKNKQFFEYKLNGKNCSLIKTEGFTMLVKGKTHLQIGDVSKFEKKQTKKLIEAVKIISRKLGCKKAIFTLSENHWLHNYLKDEITPVKSLPIGFYLYDKTFDTDKIQFSGADYDTF